MIRPFRTALMSAALVAGAACGGFLQPDRSDLTHPTGQRISVLPLGGRPHGVAVAPNGTFFVTQIDAGSVTQGLLAVGSERFTGQVSVGAAPAHVAMSGEGNAAYTTDQYGNTVSIVDAATNSLAGAIPLSSGGFNLLMSPDGRRIWATTSHGGLHVIDVASRRVLVTIPVGDAANGLAYDASSGTLYVSSIMAGTVTAVDVVRNLATRVYTVSAVPQRLALSPDGRELYIASESRGLEVLTPATGVVTSIAAIPLGSVGLA